MSTATFCIPGDVDTPTGGYAYARQLLAHLPEQGVAVSPLALPASFPHPSEADLARTAQLFADAPDGAMLIDGLAYGCLPPSVIAAAAPRPVVALVHHPLGLEEGLTPDEAARLIASETAALALAPRIVVTSPFTRRLLVAEFGVPPERITVAEPGTAPAPRARGGGEGPVRLLSVGTVIPRKGFAVLAAALARLTDLDWTLSVVGALDRAPDHVAALRETIAAVGLTERIAFEGAMPAARLDSVYDGADIMVSPSLFEGYGMALAEALARGLPIVATTGGAAADTVPDAAGAKVPPGDDAALAAALRPLVADPARRRAVAQAAWEAGQRLPQWRDTARIVADVLKEARS